MERQTGPVEHPSADEATVQADCVILWWKLPSPVSRLTVESSATVLLPQTAFLKAADFETARKVLAAVLREGSPSESVNRADVQAPAH